MSWDPYGFSCALFCCAILKICLKSNFLIGKLQMLVTKPPRKNLSFKCKGSAVHLGLEPQVVCSTQLLEALHIWLFEITY